MPIKEHGRTYDIVVFGANGYTGTYIAEHITKSHPTNLKWALAGRSHDKLTKLAAHLKELHPDRLQPAIEIVTASEEELEQLAKKTFVLIAAVGPYIKYGEPAFRACAQNGTHYFDMTGDVPFMAGMTRKYEAAAKASGAIMVPQCGIESAPADLVTWMVAKVNRTQLQAQTSNVTVSVSIKGMPSGGTLNTVFTAFGTFSLKDMRDMLVPFALSPVPKAHASRGPSSLLQRLTGVVSTPHLGTMTTALTGTTDAPYVERTWGLLSSIPSRQHEAYGPNFSFSEYLRAHSWGQGAMLHWTFILGGLLLYTLPPLRWLARRYAYQPGEGATKEQSKGDRMEYRAIGTPDFADKAAAETTRQKASCRARFQGGMYELTGILVSEGALTLLEDDVQLDGGVYTAATLGQGFIDRLQKAQFQFEAGLVDGE